jgi:hypothetical protein
MRGLRVIHELYGDVYMETDAELVKLKLDASGNIQWETIALAGTDLWLRRLRDIRSHPDTHTSLEAN